MTPDFHAGHVSIEDKGDQLVIGLVDDKSLVDDYLILQRAYAFDEQDRRLGMDNIHIERNDQGCSIYGGIESFELLPDKIRVRFDERGSEVMAGIQVMEVSFEADHFEALQLALQRCFKGFPCYSEIAA